MKYATTADLRDNLSAYLRDVEAGERVVVLRRDRPVAVLGPPLPALATDDALERRLEALEREGVIRRGAAEWPEALLEPLRGPSSGVLEALLREREEDR